jgi:hypothetical protein
MPVYTSIRNGHYLGPSRTVRPMTRVYWRLLLQRNGDLYLRHLALLSTDQAVEVLQKLLKEFQESQSWLVNAVPFLVPAIYVATMDSVRYLATPNLLPF